jgi:hypothetical protein
MTVNSKLSKAALLRKLADVEEQLAAAYDALNIERLKTHTTALSRDNNAAELAKVSDHNKFLKAEEATVQRQFNKQYARADAYMDVIKEFIRKD